eukprot:365917-Chlamydomonas_euryale.AAC.11
MSPEKSTQGRTESLPAQPPPACFTRGLPVVPHSNRLPYAHKRREISEGKRKMKTVTRMCVNLSPPWMGTTAMQGNSISPFWALQPHRETAFAQQVDLTSAHPLRALEMVNSAGLKSTKNVCFCAQHLQGCHAYAAAGGKCVQNCTVSQSVLWMFENYQMSISHGGCGLTTACKAPLHARTCDWRHTQLLLRTGMGARHDTVTTTHTLASNRP